MPSMPAFVNQSLMPALARWHALDAGPRRLISIGAVLLAAGFLLAFVWLPAVRARDASTARLPQLEAQLAAMRSQAIEVKALANQPAAPVLVRTVADVAALQSVFGSDAQITVADGGFRVLIPAVAYASWWDKTGEAMSRFGLVLRTASIRPTNPGASLVAVDMLLGADSQGAGASAARQGK